jgi:hypothetical protein
MSKIWLVGLVAIGMTVGARLASAEDISAKKILIKDQASDTVQVLSVDGAIAFGDAGDPAANGAALHVYSASDDFCATLPAGAGWANKKNKVWKYKSKATKSSALLKAGKLLVTIKSGVTYTLQDNGTQGTVNAQVQFGTGTRFCMKCSGAKKDEASKFLGKGCVAAACDPEPSSCDPPIATATTSTTGSATTSPTGSSTSTSLPSGGEILKGALAPPTKGRFNYNSTIGLPGVTAACTTQFPGTHPCTQTELGNAQTAGDLVGLKDSAMTTVTSLWAIDGSAPALEQCQDDGAGGSLLNWEYGTAHTASRGRKFALNNGAGTLTGPTLEQCFLLGTTSWVGCCQ